MEQTVMEQTPKEKKTFSSSLLFAILCVNLGILLVMAALNYQFIYRRYNRTYQERFVEYNEKVMELAFNNIDKLVTQSVEKIPQLYFSSLQENQPILLPQEEQIADSPQKIQALMAELSKIQKVYPYLDGVDIYYEATQTIVTGFNNIHFPANEQMKERYLPWYRDYMSGNLKEGFQFETGSAYAVDHPVLTYIKRISKPKWDGKEIVVAVYLDPKSYGEFIDLQQGKLSILSKDHRLIYESAEDEGIQSGITEQIIQYAEQNQMDLRAGETPFSVSLTDSDLMVFHDVSPDTRLLYLYSVNAERFYRDFDATYRMLLVNFIGFILFNVVAWGVIICYNHFAYRRRIHAVTEKAGIKIQEGDRGFDASLNLLTKEVTSMHETITSSKGILLQNTVRALMFGKNPEEELTKVEEYLNGESVCTFLFISENPKQDMISVEPLQEKFQPGQGTYDVLFTTVDRDRLAAFVIFHREDWEQVSEDFLARITSNWPDCRVVSGDICEVQDNGIRKSYGSAQEAARYLYIFTEEQYLPIEKIKIEERKGSGSHQKILDGFRRGIYSENVLGVKSHLEMLIVSFKSGSYTIDYCMSTLRDLMTLMYQIMQQYQLDMWVVFGYDIREYYKHIPNIDQFYAWCSDMCETMMKNIYEKKQSVDLDVREQILILLETDEKDLSLDFLASQLNMRPDAASRVFRQVMGKGYSEYIKDKKMKTAVELLSQDWAVKDIAERMGYSSAQYFIKVFKEEYGMTPHQYKKKLQQEES